jgi:biotin carboxyl carrier protein
MITSPPPRGTIVLRSALGLLVLIAVIALVWIVRARRPVAKESGEETGETAIAPPNRLRVLRGPLGDEGAIVVGSIALERLGIVTRVLASAVGVERVRLTGVLIADPSRTTAIRAPLAGRLVSPGETWPALGQSVAAGTVLGQVSDARPFAAPRSGAVTNVSAQPGELVQAGQTLLEITDFSRPLARIVWRDDAPLPAPRTLTLTSGSEWRADSIEVEARLVGPAATVDSLTRAPVYLYRLSKVWSGARPGAPVIALAPDPSRAAHGLFVPADAVVQWQGLTWIYVKHGRDAFVRRPLDTSHPVTGGWIVSSGVAPTDTVVVRGAQLLLSEEFRSRVSVGDED